MSTAARQTWDSPDPLTEDESLASTPPRHSRERHTRSRTPTRKHSSARQAFELDVGDTISPQRIRVTVEAEPEYATGNSATQRPISSSSGSGVRLSPTPYYSTPFKPRTMKVKTTTVPLRGLSDSEAENGAPMLVATPARGRGRPRKSAATPIPTKGKRIVTPVAKIAKTKGAETPGTKSRRLSDLLHTGGSSGDNSEEWDFNIPQHITTGRGRSESHARIGPYDGREDEERASSEVPMSSRANKRGRRIGVEGTPSGFGFSYKKPKIGQSRLRRLDFEESQLGREERRSSESIVEPDQADDGFGPYDDSSRPSTADSLLNGRHVSSSPPNAGGDVAGNGYALTPSQRKAGRRQSMGYQEFSFARYDDEDSKSSSMGSTGAADVIHTTKPPSPPHTESPAQESDDQWIEPPAQEQRRVSPHVPAHREPKQSTERYEPPMTEKPPEQQYHDHPLHFPSPKPAAQAQRAVSPQLRRQATHSPEQQYYDQDSHSSSPAQSVASAGVASTAQTSQKPPSPPAQNYEDEEAVEDQDWSLTQSRREILRSPPPILAPSLRRFPSHEPGRDDREESLRGGAGQPQSHFVEEQQYYDQGSHSPSAAPTQSRHSSHSRPSAEVDVPFPSLSPESLHQQIRSASQSFPHHTEHIPLNDIQNNAEDDEERAFVEFDTIIENEDFTMISADTVPSLLQFFTSPLDPNEQAEIRAEIAAEEVALAEVHEEETELARLERELAAAERREETARRRMRASGFQDIVHETIERSVSHEVEMNIRNDAEQEHDLELEDGQDWSLTQSRSELPRSPSQTQDVPDESFIDDHDPEAVEKEERNPMLSRNQIPRSPIPALEDDLRDGKVQQEYYDQDSHSSSPERSEIQEPGNEDDASQLGPPPTSHQIPRSPPQTQEVDENDSEEEEQDLSHLSPPPARRELPRSPPQTQDVQMEEVQDDEQEEQYEQDWSLTQSRHEIPRSPLPAQSAGIVEEISFVQPRVKSRELETDSQEQDEEQDWSLAQSRHEIPCSPLPGQRQEVVQEMVMEEVAVLRSSALLTPDETPSLSRADIAEEIHGDIPAQVHEEPQQEGEQDDVDIWALEASAYDQTRNSIHRSSAPPEKPAAETPSAEASQFSWKRASKASAEPKIHVVQEQEQRRSSPVPALKRSLQSQEAAGQTETKASSPVPALKRSLQHTVEVQEQPVEEVMEGGEDEDVWMAEASVIQPNPEPAIEHFASPIPNLLSPPKREPRAEPQPQTTAASAITKVAPVEAAPAVPLTPVFKRSLQRSQVEIELEEVLQKARKRRSGLPEDWMRQSQGNTSDHSMRTSHSAFDNTVNQDDSHLQARHHDEGNTSFGLTLDGAGEERPSMIGDASILRRETRQREAEERKLRQEAEARRIRELAASKEAERQRRREERELERRKRAEELEKELQREREEREAKREVERRKRREEREGKRDEEINREREERYKFKLAEDEKARQKEEGLRKAEEQKVATEATRKAELQAQQETQRRAEDDRIAQEAALKAQAEAERQAELEAERLILEAKRAAEREEARVAELRKKREAAKQRRREERQAELEAEQTRIARADEAQRLAEVEAEKTKVAEEREAQREDELRKEREAAKQRRQEEREAELEAIEKKQAEERVAREQAGLRKEREAAKQRRREERQAELEAEEQRQADERDAVGKGERRQGMDKENFRHDSERTAKKARFEPRATRLHRSQFREQEIEQPSQKKTERLPFTRIPTSAHPISHKVFDHGQEKMSTSYALSPLKVSRKENEDEENPFRRSGQGKRTFEPREALVDTKQSAAGMPKPDFLFDPPSRFMKKKVKEDFEFNPPAQHPVKAFAVSDTSGPGGGKSGPFRRQVAPSSMDKELEMVEVKQQKLPALRRVMKSVEFDPPYSDGLRTASVSEEEVDESEAEDDDENNPFMAAEKSVSGSVERSMSRSVERSVSKGESEDESGSRSENRGSSGSATPKASRDLTATNDAAQQHAEYPESEKSSDKEAISASSSSSENGDVDVHVDAKTHGAPSLSGSPSPSVASQQSRSSQFDSDFNSISNEDKENQQQSLDEHDDDEDDDDASMVDVEEDEDEDSFSSFSDSENEIVASTPMPPRGLQAPMRQPLRTVKPQPKSQPESSERPHQRRRPQIEDSDENSENSGQSQDEDEESQSRSQSESDDELEIEEEKQRQNRRSTSSLPHAGFRTGNFGPPLKSSLRHPPPLGSPKKAVVFSATTAVSPESSFEESSEVNEGLTAALDRLAGEDSDSESGSQALSPSSSRSPSALPSPSIEGQQFEDEEQAELDDRSHLQMMKPYNWAKSHWKVLLSIKNQFESDPCAGDDIPDWIQNSPYVDETIWGAEEDGSMDLVVEPWMVYVAQLFIETRQDAENGSEDWRGQMEEVIKRVYGLVSVERKCAREGKRSPWETPSGRVRTFQEVKRRTVERLDKEGRWVEVKPERRGFFGFGTAWL